MGFQQDFFKVYQKLGISYDFFFFEKTCPN